MVSSRSVPLVRIPEPNSAEKKWVIKQLLSEHLGIEFRIEHSSDTYIELQLGHRKLFIADVLLGSTDRAYLSAQLPELPLSTWNPSSIRGSGQHIDPLPVLYGRPQVTIDSNDIRCGIDIFGTAFFLLSGLEELLVDTRDEHGRFSGISSLAYRAGFLDRPLVDEYTEVLWNMITVLCPSLERRPIASNVVVTCDVDYPFDQKARTPRQLLRRLKQDVFDCKNPKLALQRLTAACTNRLAEHGFDSNYSFDWYMDTCEANNRRAIFFFLAGQTSAKFDGSYSIRDNRIQSVMRNAIRRGHEISVHSSYDSYRDDHALRRELLNFLDACAIAEISLTEIGNRQHYLRWLAKETPAHLAAVGYNYDSTGGFADRPGFRYGTARPFRMWGWMSRASLDLIQRPLILMDSTIFASRYLAMAPSESTIEYMARYRERATRLGGEFVLLWHNSNLGTTRHRLCLQELIR